MITLFTKEMRGEMKLRGCRDCTYYHPGFSVCTRGIEHCVVHEPRRTIRKGRYWYDLPSHCRYCYFWDPKTQSCQRGGPQCCAYLTEESAYQLPPPEVPERPKGPCDDCPYGRKEPCIGVCMKELLKDWRKERKEAAVYA